MDAGGVTLSGGGQRVGGAGKTRRGWGQAVTLRWTHAESHPGHYVESENRNGYADALVQYGLFCVRRSTSASDALIGEIGSAKQYVEPKYVTVVFLHLAGTYIILFCVPHCFRPLLSGQMW